MNASTEFQSAVPVEKKSRLGKLLRWAVRLTSIPIFALLLISLVPALGSFNVSARDDKVIAVGLCGIAAGFLTGWRWAGIGGLLTLLSVGVILSQEGGSISSDPFAVAFGLQGILFLLSWAVTAGAQQKAGLSLQNVWLKRAVGALLAVSAVVGTALIVRGPGPTPVAREQEAYVGSWTNGSGFQIDISSEGRAKISQDKEAKVAECNTPVAPGGSGEFLVQFHDDRLELSSGVLGQTKTYHIDRRPFPRGKQITMVLNGSDPYSRTNGITLVKKQAPNSIEARPPKPVAKTRSS